MKASTSPVIAFLQSVWDNSNSGRGHSWSILNGSLYTALKLAITSHYKFEPDDFHEAYRRFKGGYWFHTDPDGKGMGTWFYTAAVGCGNMSAAQSFEKWTGTAPFLFLGKRLCIPGHNNDDGLMILREDAPAIVKAQKCKTDEQALEVLRRSQTGRWWVTGFNETHIRLASYYTEKNTYGHREGTPTKLKKLTHDELAAISKEIRAAMKPAKKKEAA